MIVLTIRLLNNIIFGFKRVLISLFWATLILFSNLEFKVKETIIRYILFSSNNRMVSKKRSTNGNPNNITNQRIMKTYRSRLVLIILAVLLIPVSTASLVYAAAVFRHGARYPLASDYDIYDSVSLRNSSGILTAVGMKQLYRLGLQMKLDYVDKEKIIDMERFSEGAEVFTSPILRCIESAVAFSLGMFSDASDPSNIPKPFTSNQQYLTQHGYKLQSVSQQNQYTLQIQSQSLPFKIRQTTFLCGRQQDLILQRYEKIKAQLLEFQNEEKEFLERIQDVFALKEEYRNLIGLRSVYDIVICSLYLGRMLPESFTQKDLEKLTYIQAYLFAILYSDDVAKAFISRMMNEILTSMENIIKGNGETKPKNFSFYSGHDSNLVSFMNFLNLTSADCIVKQWKKEPVEGNCAEIVPFASNLVFQLRESDIAPGDYFVKIRYNGDYYKLCGTDLHSCDYDDFVSRVRTGLAGFQNVCWGDQPLHSKQKQKTRPKPQHRQHQQKTEEHTPLE